MNKQTAKEAATIMSDFVNSFSNPEDDFCKEMSFQHRTLQQSFTKLALRWLETVASPNYMTDGRNMDSQEVARKLIDNSPEFYNEPSKALRCV